MNDLNQLYQQIQAGNISLKEELFKVLLVRFRSFAHHRIKNLDEAEDVVQSAIVAINEEFEKLEVRSSFSAWAYKVLDFRILSHLKDSSKHRKRFVSFDHPEGLANKGASEIDPDFKRLLLNCLSKVGRANKRFARSLNLRSQGYTVEEVCDKLSITSANLYTIIKRARRMMQECIEKGGRE